ncbi:MAG: Fic family protein [Deinococcales bacterium]|nr:Fic family protein [Chitinophagaceae bacterium]
MAVYIHQLPNWPHFFWDEALVNLPLPALRHQQGKLLGKMEALGFSLQNEASLEIITLDVVKSGEIEGEILDRDQVRSSIARRLGMDIAGLIPADRNVEGIVEMMLDATQQHEQPLTNERVFSWHNSLFPSGQSGMLKIVIGAWRNNAKNNPMQVVSGPGGRETLHFEAPEAEKLVMEMELFFSWFNQNNNYDPIIKAAIAHLWFVTIHPLDDGNGRIARAITDMQLARADNSSHRFYSMSAQIRKERKTYYHLLESTQKDNLDITDWLLWFLACCDRSIDASNELLAVVLAKAKFWEINAKTLFNARQILLINKLLDGFNGKLNSSKWAVIAKCSQDTALRDIQDLMDKKVLRKENSGGRSTAYELLC